MHTQDIDILDFVVDMISFIRTFAKDRNPVEKITLSQKAFAACLKEAEYITQLPNGEYRGIQVSMPTEMRVNCIIVSVPRSKLSFTITKKD